MYRETKWDSEKSILWVRGTPDGEWWMAGTQQTIQYLAERVSFLESLVNQPSVQAC